MAEQSAPSGRGWHPKPVELPNDLSKALLTALRAAAVSRTTSLSELGQESDAKAEDFKSRWRGRRKLLEPVADDSAVQTSVSSGAAATPGNASSNLTFKVGDTVQYWSGTHRKWLKACVLSIDSAGGNYNLDLKAKVGPSLIKSLEDDDGDEPQAQQASPDSANAGASMFSVGMHVQCWNLQKQQWQQGTVSRRYQNDGVTVFDVDSENSVLRMLPASRLRLARFAAGDAVEYWSNSAQQWLRAKVLRIVWSKQTCDLDIKQRAPLSSIRKVEGSETPAEVRGDTHTELVEKHEAQPAQSNLKDEEEDEHSEKEEDESGLDDALLADLGQDWQDQVYDALQEAEADKKENGKATDVDKSDAKEKARRNAKRRRDKEAELDPLSRRQEKSKKSQSLRGKDASGKNGSAASRRPIREKKRSSSNQARRVTMRSRSRAREKSKSRSPLRRVPLLVPRDGASFAGKAGSRQNGDHGDPGWSSQNRRDARGERDSSRHARPQERDRGVRSGRDREARTYENRTEGRDGRDREKSFRDELPRRTGRQVPEIPSRQGHEWSDRR